MLHTPLAPIAFNPSKKKNKKNDLIRNLNCLRESILRILRLPCEYKQSLLFGFEMRTKLEFNRISRIIRILIIYWDLIKFWINWLQNALTNLFSTKDRESFVTRFWIAVGERNNLKCERSWIDFAKKTYNTLNLFWLLGFSINKKNKFESLFTKRLNWVCGLSF